MLRTLSTFVFGATLFSRVFAFTPTFPYGTEKVRGVNLGGWLVLEPWITPSLFENTGNEDIVDEYTFGKYQDKEVAAAVLKQHWDTWITEDDIAAIAAAGLNHLRIPIGYWAFEDSSPPYIQGQLPYLEKAIGWASEYGLKVLVDLHGVPGSQNGFDNSGHRRIMPKWHTKQSYVDRANAIIKTLATSYRDRAEVVAAIAPLNEPAGFYGDDVLNVVKQYWYDSYGNVRFPYGTADQGNNLLVIHDAFQSLDYWKNEFTGSGFDGVAIDVHKYYQMFTNTNDIDRDQRITNACSLGGELSSFHLWTIVGEWTAAYSDCAKYLNGRGRGNRWDGTFKDSVRVGNCGQLTGSGSDFSSAYKTFLRKYWEAQVITYEKGAGWIQWTWKAENADEWTYRAGLAYGWIPQNPTDYKYPDICG